MAEPIEQAFFGLLKFFFKLVIYWPILGLFRLCQWLYYKHRAAKTDQELRDAIRERDEWHAQQRNERSSGNTLYAGSQQHDK